MGVHLLLIGLSAMLAPKRPWLRQAGPDSQMVRSPAYSQRRL
jgi:hypothetical protein